MTPMSKTKRCPCCGEDKDVSAFRRATRSKDGLQSYCRDCSNAANREHYSRNKAQMRSRNRDYTLKSLYGITREDFEQLWTHQRGRCAICEEPLHRGRGGKAATVDHNHQTGKVRALLCGECNFGLGKFRDDPDLLRTAARYLERFK